MGSSISYYLNSTYAMQQLIDYQNEYLLTNLKNKFTIYVSDKSTNTYENLNQHLDEHLHENLDEHLDENLNVYILYIYIDPSLSSDVKQQYVIKASQHNERVQQFLNNKNINSDMSQYCYDAGFDLLNVDQEAITKVSSESIFNIVLDHKIKCAMTFNNYYVSYYLYSRSSTATKTPLRLANSVGIIDSGYRGNIKAVFDINLAYFNKNSEFKIEFLSRYVQITPPDLSNYPMKVVIVENLDELGINTLRQDGGFGSTGK
jgi:dUTP pyrophosphatase